MHVRKLRTLCRGIDGHADHVLQLCNEDLTVDSEKPDMCSLWDCLPAAPHIHSLPSEQQSISGRESLHGPPVVSATQGMDDPEGDIWEEEF